MNNVKWGTFLKDVFIAALGSYGGPEAHYGVFQSQLVEDKQFLTEEELSELIGLYSLVPGPGSTQTITAIGYHVGGPVLAILTFLVWAFPAIIIMTLFGVFFTYIDGNDSWEPLLTYLPAAAVGFIVYAAYNMTKKVNKKRVDWFLYAGLFLLSFLFAGRSIWSVPLILLAGGFIVLLLNREEYEGETIQIQPKWWILLLIVGIALVNEIINRQNPHPIIQIFTSFYRYGYSAMGGGQVVIPLMIQELVEIQLLIARADFLSGYAIDQAIPGPLFSFAAFVSARALTETGYSFFAGIVGGLAIFMPGILLVFFMFPLWRSMRQHTLMRYFLKGTTIAVAALITMTAINETISLQGDIVNYLVMIASAVLLLSKKIPAPLVIVGAGALGFLI